MRDDWFHTGDIATRDPHGRLRIVGRRATDLIKTGGYKVGAGEIETSLLDHPGVTTSPSPANPMTISVSAWSPGSSA